jgi:chromate transporter
MKRLKLLFQLFISMLKIGAFTFGGGYAMISLIENEFVKCKGWIEGEEFMDLVTIAESTPGPIAINCATYIGYKHGRMLGAIIATLGMTLPSFTVIYLISLFFDSFLSVKIIAAAFRGIRVAVIFLILSAGIKMFKKIKKTPFNVSVFLVTALSMIAFSLFSIGFSSILYILISAALGISVYSIGYVKSKNRAKGGNAEK